MQPQSLQQLDRQPANLRLADRALHEWSRQRPLWVDGWWVLAVDRADSALAWPDAAGKIQLVITGTRALRLGLDLGLDLSSDPAAKRAYAIALPADADWTLARYLSQAHLASPPATLALRLTDPPPFADSLLDLARFGQVLPALLIWPATEKLTKDPTGDTTEDPIDALIVEPAALAGLQASEQASLSRLARVDIPLERYGPARFHLYRTLGLSEGPLAIELGDSSNGSAEAAPLVRLHSSCLTGDLFGSLRCDCGPQLNRALAAMQAEAKGVLIYLFQEGRNTGLGSKLRAYGLQDHGLDTIDADATLGFAPDERDFGLAAAVLRDLGLSRIRLMTNNPDKTEALAAEGIEVVERVPLAVPANPHNAAYLATKAGRAGHQF